MSINILHKTYRFFLRYICPSIFIGFIILLISYPEGFRSLSLINFVVLYSLSIGILFISIATLINNKLEKSIPWLKYPLKRFIISLLFEVIAGTIVLIVVNIIFFMLIKGQNFNEIYSRVTTGFIYLVSFVLFGIIAKNSVFFFKNWKQSAINEEILKREKLSVEYEVLKNQVNPHFLFNNLTALSSLVYKDQNKASAFIQQFANVFRYILEFRSKEIVDLATESKLLNSIAFLYQIRHENDLQINIQLSNSIDKYIIPMALQMLLENAIKHNIISDEKPLIIEIKDDGDFVVVKNNLQPKEIIAESNKVGLKNIQLRYKYLSDKDVIIEKTNQFFTVKIPILIRNDKSTNN